MIVTVSAYKCFEKFFDLINKEVNAVDENNVITDFDKIKGLDQLWDLVLSIRDEEVCRGAIEYLNQLYDFMNHIIFNNHHHRSIIIIMIP